MMKDVKKLGNIKWSFIKELIYHVIVSLTSKMDFEEILKLINCFKYLGKIYSVLVQIIGIIANKRGFEIDWSLARVKIIYSSCSNCNSSKNIQLYLIKTTSEIKPALNLNTFLGCDHIAVCYRNILLDYFKPLNTNATISILHDALLEGITECASMFKADIWLSHISALDLTNSKGEIMCYIDNHFELLIFSLSKNSVYCHRCCLNSCRHITNKIKSQVESEFEFKTRTRKAAKLEGLFSNHKFPGFLKFVNHSIFRSLS